VDAEAAFLRIISASGTPLITVRCIQEASWHARARKALNQMSLSSAVYFRTVVQPLGQLVGLFGVAARSRGTGGAAAKVNTTKTARTRWRWYTPYNDKYLMFSGVGGWVMVLRWRRS